MLINLVNPTLDDIAELTGWTIEKSSLVRETTRLTGFIQTPEFNAHYARTRSGAVLTIYIH